MAGDLKECLLGAVEANLIDKDFADQGLKMYEDYYKASEALLLDPAKRVRYASDEVIKLLEGELQHAKRIKLQTLMTKLELEKYLEDAKIKHRAIAALAAPISGTPVVRNLQIQEDIIVKRITAPLNDFLLKFEKGAFTGSRTAIGTKEGVFPRHKELLDLQVDIVKELHNPGETTNELAKKFAQALNESFEYARLLYNQSGGAIRFNKKWALPQPHHMGKIIKAGEENWIAEITPLLDRDNMLDAVSGLPLNDDELNALLKRVYKSITTEGRNDLDAWGGSGFSTGKSIAKRHLEHRVLVFKNGESYLNYQKKFGEADIFDTIMNHFKSMAKDTASMQVLGPDAENTVRFLRAKILTLADEQAAAGDINAVIRAKRGANKFETMWQVHKGIEESDNPKVSNFFANFRALTMAAKLGYTPLIAAPTDMATSRKMAKLLGMSQFTAIKNYLSELMAINPTERKRAALELGMLNESMLDATSTAMSRYLHEDNVGPFFRFITDSSLRLNGLTKITESGRRAAGFTIMGGYADVVGKSFDQLSPQMQRGLLRYTIDADKWNKIRQAPLSRKTVSGLNRDYLSPNDILKVKGLDPAEARQLADDYTRLLYTEVEVAVPTAGYEERASLRGLSRPGSIPGEIVGSFAMFKSWPMRFYHSHLERSWMEADTPMKKAAAIVDTALFMLMGGALGYQLMEIAKGRKPSTMTIKDFNPEDPGMRFWGNALARSGGLGPLFDIAVGLTDYRQGLSGYVAGPVIGSIDGIGYAIFGSAKDIYEGDPAGAGTRVIKEVLKHTPYQSNWMINLAIKRMLWERMLLWNDPEYVKQINKEIRRSDREGKEYWWMPNDFLPNESPFN